MHIISNMLFMVSGGFNMIMLVLALIFNGAESAQMMDHAVKDPALRYARALKVSPYAFPQFVDVVPLKAVSFADLDKLWKNRKRSVNVWKNKKAQTTWKSIRNFLQNRPKKNSEAQLELNRNIVLSWMLRAMMLDAKCDFVCEQDLEKRKDKMLHEPHDLAQFDFDTPPEVKSDYALFNRFVPENCPVRYLFSLPNMKRVLIVAKKPTVAERAIALRQSVMLLYVDTSIIDSKRVLESLIEQTAFAELKDPHPSYPSAQDMKKALESLQDASKRECLSCAYLLSLSWPYYAPDVEPLQFAPFYDFWKKADGFQWTCPHEFCKARIPGMTFEMICIHHQERKDARRILSMCGLNDSKLEYAFSLLREMHPAAFGSRA